MVWVVSVSKSKPASGLQGLEGSGFVLRAPTVMDLGTQSRAIRKRLQKAIPLPPKHVRFTACKVPVSHCAVDEARHV